MSRLEMPTYFMAKTWIFTVQLLVFGGLAAFGLILGPLFFLGFMNKANGAPATDAGIGLTAMSLPFLMVSALALYNIMARRRPLLRICREGIEIVQIGSSSLDRFPLIPGVIRVAWLILSRQGFKRRIVRIPWHCFRDAWVSGPPMAQSLTIYAPQSDATGEDLLEGPSVADQIVLPEVIFSTPLDHIVAAINWNANASLDMRHLASWDEVGG